MTTRSILVAALEPLLPAGTKIVDVPRTLDGFETKKPVLMVYRERVAKAPNAQGAYLQTFTAWTVSPVLVGQKAEDALDAFLDVVIEALDGVKWLSWTTAERTVFGDQMAPAYKIELTVLTNKE